MQGAIQRASTKRGAARKTGRALRWTAVCKQRGACALAEPCAGRLHLVPRRPSRSPMKSEMRVSMLTRLLPPSLLARSRSWPRLSGTAHNSRDLPSEMQADNWGRGRLVSKRTWVHMAAYGGAAGNAGGCGARGECLRQLLISCCAIALAHAFILSMSLVASVWADNALQMVRALVRVARRRSKCSPRQWEQQARGAARVLRRQARTRASLWHSGSSKQ